MKAFLLSFSRLALPEHVQVILTKSQAVSTWLAPFPYSAIILSKLNAIELSAIFRTYLGEAWFIVTELSQESCDGFLPKQCWDYINNPYGSWSQELLAGIEAMALKSPKPPMLPELPALMTRKKDGV